MLEKPARIISTAAFRGGSRTAHADSNRRQHAALTCTRKRRGAPQVRKRAPLDAPRGRYSAAAVLRRLLATQPLAGIESLPTLDAAARRALAVLVPHLPALAEIVAACERLDREVICVPGDPQHGVVKALAGVHASATSKPSRQTRPASSRTVRRGGEDIAVEHLPRPSR
jgi:hypothetical protein